MISKSNLISFVIGAAITSAVFFLHSDGDDSVAVRNELREAKDKIVVLDSLYQNNLMEAERHRENYLYHLDSLSLVNDGLDSLNKLQLEILYEQDHDTSDSCYNNLKLNRFK